MAGNHGFISYHNGLAGNNMAGKSPNRMVEFVGKIIELFDVENAWLPKENDLQMVGRHRTGSLC